VRYPGSLSEGARVKSSAELDEIELALATLRRHSDDEYVAAFIFDKVLDLIRPHHQSMFWGDRILTLDRSTSFRHDPDFQKAISAASSSTGANQYASPDGITWRFHTLIWAARQALTVAGDFIECGVYEGDMSWVLTEMIDLAAAGRRLHLFDTFAGFSPRYSSPADYPDRPEFFALADRDYRRPEIYEHVKQRFAAKPYVTIHRGTVPETLVEAPATIAFLHIDMNSPGPERAALEVLYDRVSPGGVFIFDDYGWEIFKMQKQAADEFISAKGHTIVELPTGQGLAIKPA
jgi:O-methyltransferase